MNEDNKKPQNPKRVLLSELSRQAEELRDTMAEAATTEEEAMFWSTRTINYMLLNHIYETNGATEFNTFNQWKEQGATIKKGEKAFLIWGQPLSAQRRKEAEAKGEPADDEDDKFKYFPLCYLFSDKQVITAEEIAKQKEEQQERKQKEEALARMEPVDLDNIL